MKAILATLLVSMNTVAFGVIQHAYVTEFGSNSVSVIDVDRNTVQKIFGFASPHTVRVTYDGVSAYVGDNDNSIYKINCLHHTVSKIATLSGHPISFCIVPDASYLYCATHNNTVEIIDLSTLKLVKEIACLDGPQDIRCTPDGKYVYVTNKGNGTVSVIETATQTLANTITGLKLPIGITFDLNGIYGYISDAHDNQVCVIRLSDNEIVETILGFSTPGYIAMDPKKSVAYISNTGNDTISILRLSDNFVLGSISVPNPKSLSVSLDGLYLYVASGLTEVLKINLLDESIESVISDLAIPSNISITSNNGPGDTVNGWHVITDPSDPFNQIRWEKPAGDPIKYRIYRDPKYTNLVGEIEGSEKMLYSDEHLIPGQTYAYYVIADYDNGFSSTIGHLTVPPERVGLPR